MASDLLSLADASALLGVSSERVRQLVVAGDLPGVRFGNAWAVPRDSIDARRHVSNRQGRPLGDRRAWESIVAGDVDLSNVSRYRNRGEVQRLEMSPADLQYLAEHDQVLVSGVAAAIAYGELLQEAGAGADLYLSVSLFNELRALIAAIPDQLGNVVVRLVGDELWPYLERLGRDDSARRFAPSAAVALDLAESGDPRHWVAAEHLIEARE